MWRLENITCGPSLPSADKIIAQCLHLLIFITGSSAGSQVPSLGWNHLSEAWYLPGSWSKADINSMVEQHSPSGWICGWVFMVVHT